MKQSNFLLFFCFFICCLENAIAQEDDRNPQFFAPKGAIPNREAYDKSTLEHIKASEAKMGVYRNFGGLEGTPLHITNGAILYGKMTRKNWVKLQIISFGKKGEHASELYIRYTLYDKKNGEILWSLEYLDKFTLFSDSFGFDINVRVGSKDDLRWYIDNGALFLNANREKGAKFYLLKEGDFKTGSNLVEAKPQTTIKTENLLSSATIRWTHALNNNAITNDSIFKITACVETSETINDYLLMRNGQRVSVPRNLIPRQDNDCLNHFSNVVTLKQGENEYQLIVKTKNGNVKSDIFKVRYDSKAVVEQKTRRLALVIGNSAYEYAKPLPNPTNDATDITTALKDIGFEVISATNADLRKMNEKLDEFSDKLKDYDIGLFYYAGHGLQVGGANYLVPVNAKPKTEGEVSLDCFSVARVLARMEAVRNRANLIILDACRDNPLSRSLVFRQASRTTADPGLARIDAHAGTLIGFATAAGATAEDGNGRNGTYTEALLKHLRNPNLSVVQLFTAVSGTVQTATDKKQVPWINSSLSEDLYLTK